jgi:hypothetical protein
VLTSRHTRRDGGIDETRRTAPAMRLAYRQSAALRPAANVDRCEARLNKSWTFPAAQSRPSAHGPARGRAHRGVERTPAAQQRKPSEHARTECAAPIAPIPTRPVGGAHEGGGYRHPRSRRRQLAHRRRRGPQPGLQEARLASPAPIPAARAPGVLPGVPRPCRFVALVGGPASVGPPSCEESSRARARAADVGISGRGR